MFERLQLSRDVPAICCWMIAACSMSMINAFCKSGIDGVAMSHGWVVNSILRWWWGVGETTNMQNNL